MNVKTRNVSLTPEIEAFINERVASGRFRSASEVVRAALRLLEDEEHRRKRSGHGHRDGDGPLAETDGASRCASDRLVQG
jgi:antitoxin ParD1/3/4